MVSVAENLQTLVDEQRRRLDILSETALPGFLQSLNPTKREAILNPLAGLTKTELKRLRKVLRPKQQQRQSTT